MQGSGGLEFGPLSATLGYASEGPSALHLLQNPALGLLDPVTAIGHYIGIMENGSYHSILGILLGYWKRKWKLLSYIGDYIGILEKKMEATIVYWGFYWDTGKENGSRYSVCLRMLDFCISPCHIGFRLMFF